jgi:hypothetical protein
MSSRAHRLRTSTRGQHGPFNDVDRDLEVASRWYAVPDRQVLIQCLVGHRQVTGEAADTGGFWVTFNIRDTPERAAPELAADSCGEQPGFCDRDRQFSPTMERESASSTIEPLAAWQCCAGVARIWIHRGGHIKGGLGQIRRVLWS